MGGLSDALLTTRPCPMQMDSMMDSDDLPSHPHPANAHSSQAHLHSAFAQPNSSRAYDPTAQPHHAPPLHFHLAGCPQPDAVSAGLSRSSSASSNSSMSLSPHHNRTGYHQQHHRQPPPLAEEVPMPTMAQKKTGGGWKVTFGFRHDCQKCLDKVPGHYSHVVSDEGVFSGR